MNTAEFIREAWELVNTLERFSITRSRCCAVTLHSGDGICVAFDRSDKTAAPIHQYMNNAFPADSVIISYEPQSKIYNELLPCREEVLKDPKELAEAVQSFKDYLYRQSGEKGVGDETDRKFHAVYTVFGVIVGAKSLKELEDSVFRTEENIRKIEELSDIRTNALKGAGNAARDMVEKLRAMEQGRLYIRERKRYK